MIKTNFRLLTSLLEMKVGTELRVDPQFLSGFHFISSDITVNIDLSFLILYAQ